MVENDREAGFIYEHLYPLACNEGGDYFYWDIRDENVYMLYCDDIENPVWICASVKEFFDLLEYCGEKSLYSRNRRYPDAEALKVFNSLALVNVLNYSTEELYVDLAVLNDKTSEISWNVLPHIINTENMSLNDLYFAIV